MNIMKLVTSTLLLTGGISTYAQSTNSELTLDKDWYQNPPSEDEVFSNADREYTQARVNMARQKQLLIELNDSLEQLDKLSNYGPDVTGILNFNAFDEQNLKKMIAALNDITKVAASNTSNGLSTNQQNELGQLSASTNHLADVLSQASEGTLPAITTPPAQKETTEQEQEVAILYAEAASHEYEGKVILKLGDEPITFYPGMKKDGIHLISVGAHALRTGKMEVKYSYRGKTQKEIYPR